MDEALQHTCTSYAAHCVISSISVFDIVYSKCNEIGYIRPYITVFNQHIGVIDENNVSGDL